MHNLQVAAAGQGVQALIDQFYDYSEVAGFALGVHGQFVAQYEREFEPSTSVEEMLEGGDSPRGWADFCQGRSLPRSLSPIYVVIYVTTDPSAFQSQHQVPSLTLGSHLVLVERVSPFRALADHKRHRPVLRGGISVGNGARNDAGTLGGFLAETGSSKPLILSCAHVLGSTLGTDVTQQGKGDGGASPGDSVARTVYELPLTLPAGFSYGSPYLKADAALAELDAAFTPDRTIRRLTSDVVGIASLASLSTEDHVVFVGKESDRVEARISRFVARAKVTIDGSTYNFGDLLEIESRYPIYFGSVARPGDSGSWVLKSNNSGDYELCGLLFARSGKTALCCNAEDVVSELEAVAGTRLRPL